MTIEGIVQNGVVVLAEAAAIPDGTPVTVFVDPKQISQATNGQRMSDDEYRRVRAILDEIASLPNENPGDTFSGADHDKVLYGEP